MLLSNSGKATSPPMARSNLGNLSKVPEIMNKTGPGFFNSGSEEF